MRLSQLQVEVIKQSVKKIFNDNTKVFLFGSRVDNKKRGGDIDLYIETDILNDVFQRKIKLLVMLELTLGQQKIDVVINNFTDDLPIYNVAKDEGILL
ncbi:MAG: nucleotidyltransferase domain-containing protein [bacterium]